MLLQRIDDRLDDLLVRSLSAFDVDVRLFVGMAAFLGQPLQRLLRIASPELHARVAARCPLRENIHGRIEPDCDRTFVEKLPGSRIDISAAARRDHPHLTFDQPGDEPPLAVAEILLPEAFENLRRRISGRILDRRIAVDEGNAEPLRKPPPEGRFANAHQADEDDRAVEKLAQITHLKGYTAALKVAKSPSPPSSRKR